MKYKIQTFLLILVCFTLMAGSCQNRKKILNNAKNGTGLVLIATYKSVYQWISSRDGTKEFCRPIGEAHKVEIISGAYTENDFYNDCKRKKDKFERQFDRVLNACASTLEVFEHSLDTWDATDRRDKIDIVKNVMFALKDLERLLDISGVPVPKRLQKFTGFLEGLANSI